MKLSTTGEAMRKNDGLKLLSEPQGVHVYPTEKDGLVRIHIDLFAPEEVAKIILRTISPELLKDNKK